MNALRMAVSRRKPAGSVMVHSDQGSQFTSKDWRDFLTEHRLETSMSRRGNCHDYALAESFFQLLKRERIKRQTYVRIPVIVPTHSGRSRPLAHEMVLRG